MFVHCIASTLMDIFTILPKVNCTQEVESCMQKLIDCRKPWDPSPK